jgi:hypothetical protein
MAKRFHCMIVGQDEATHNTARAYQYHLTGLETTGRPIANSPISPNKVRLKHPLPNCNERRRNSRRRHGL